LIYLYNSYLAAAWNRTSKPTRILLFSLTHTYCTPHSSIIIVVETSTVQSIIIEEKPGSSCRRPYFKPLEEFPFDMCREPEFLNFQGAEESIQMNHFQPAYLASAGIFEQSMGARNQVGIGFSYRPARLHRLAESIPKNRFLGSIEV
jgi:hypothetical protein